MQRSVFLIITAAALASAKTDLTGCTTSDVSSPAGASVIWYVPSSGEVCEPLDCGGGRAPPKTTVPGCPQYAGTATYSPSFLPGFNGAAASTAPLTSVAAASTTAPSSAMITGSSTTEDASSSAPVSESASSTGSGLDSSSPSVTLIIGTVLTTTSESVSLPGAESSTTLSNGSVSVTSSSRVSTSTRTSSASSTRTTAASATNTSNAGAIASVHVLAPGLVGAVAAGLLAVLV